MTKGKPRGTTGVESTQIRWFSGSQAGRLDCVISGQQTLKENPKTQGRIPSSSPLRSDGSCGSQAGSSTAGAVAKNAQEEVLK